MDQEIKNNESNNQSIVGMILGIVSVVFCSLPILSIALGIVAIVLGVKGLKKSNDMPKRKGKGMGIAGISCGCVGTVLCIIYTIMWIFMAVCFKEMFDYYDNYVDNYTNSSYTTHYDYDDYDYDLDNDDRYTTQNYKYY